MVMQDIWHIGRRSWLLPIVLLPLTQTDTAASKVKSDGLDRVAVFHIEPNRMDRALLALSRQARIQVAIAPDIDGAVEAPQINSAMSVRQALNTILRHSGSMYTVVGPSTVSVTRADKVVSTLEESTLPLSTPANGVDGAGTTTSRSQSQPSQGAGSFEGSDGRESTQQSNGGSSSSNSEVRSTDGPAFYTRDEEGKPAEVVVSTYRFLAADTSGTTNLPLPIEKVPQAISLVSNDFINAADLKTLGEIAEYTPGALNVGNPGNLGYLVNLRGFAAGEAIDGINTILASAEPEYAIYDRLELVKGPSSVVYGVGSPGGTINFVTKSATPQTVDYVSLQGGSWNSFRVEGQVAGSLDSAGRVRAIGVAVRDQGDSFINVVNHQKTTAYAGLNVQLSDSLSGYLHGGYTKYVRTVFDGIPVEADGSAPPLPRSFFIGIADPKLSTSVVHGEGDLTWHATDLLEISIKGNYAHTTTDGISAYSSSLQPSGDISLVILPYTAGSRSYGIGVSSVYHLDRLGLKDSFISVGALYQDNNSPYDFQRLGLGSANIFDGIAAIQQAFSAALAGPSYLSQTGIQKSQVSTGSMQAVLKPLDPLSILLGASYSKPKSQTVTDGVESGFEFASQVSYRAGLTYEFIPKASAYASYSESFQPQTNLHCDEFSDSGGVVSCLRSRALAPLAGRQYELGVKYSSLNERLLLTGALFQIDENNVATLQQYLDTGVGYFNALGQVRHRGIELQSIGQITRTWQINAGYTYLDPKITKAVVSGTSARSATIGQMQLYLPRNTFSLYSTYTLHNTVLRGLSVGGGVRYVGTERTAYDNPAANIEAFGNPTITKNLSSYFIVDANIGYSWGMWTTQLNAHNILDRHYYINNYQSLIYGNVVGEPANFAITIRRSF